VRLDATGHHYFAGGIDRATRLSSLILGTDEYDLFALNTDAPFAYTLRCYDLTARINGSNNLDSPYGRPLWTEKLAISRFLHKGRDRSRRRVEHLDSSSVTPVTYVRAVLVGRR
jgi:hypothetical protein